MTAAGGETVPGLAYFTREQKHKAEDREKY